MRYRVRLIFASMLVTIGLMVGTATATVAGIVDLPMTVIG